MTNWTDRVENLLLITVALVIAYIGDGNQNLISLARFDDRIQRHWLLTAHCLVTTNVSLFFYLLLKGKCCKWGAQMKGDFPNLIKIGTFLTVASICAYCIAFWPLFHWLTLFIIPFVMYGILLSVDLYPSSLQMIYSSSVHQTERKQM